MPDTERDTDLACGECFGVIRTLDHPDKGADSHQRFHGKRQVFLRFAVWVLPRYISTSGITSPAESIIEMPQPLNRDATVGSNTNFQLSTGAIGILSLTMSTVRIANSGVEMRCWPRSP